MSTNTAIIKVQGLNTMSGEGWLQFSFNLINKTFLELEVPGYHDSSLWPKQQSQATEVFWDIWGKLSWNLTLLFLEPHHQQKEDWGKCEPAAKCGKMFEWQRRWKRPRYSMLSLPCSLPVRPVFRNPRFPRPQEGLEQGKLTRGGRRSR